MRYAGFAVITALLTGLPVMPQAAPAPAANSGPANSGGDALDVNRTLFAVMVAANLSGYDAGMTSASNSPVRRMPRPAWRMKAFPPTLVWCDPCCGK